MRNGALPAAWRQRVDAALAIVEHRLSARRGFGVFVGAG